MNNELSDRQQAIKLRLAGRSVEEICRILGRSPAWFHIWWRRYRALGPNGLFDLTRTTTQPRRITPDLERSILNIRRRLISQTHPGTRYSLIGAGSILAELQVLHIHPLPSPRTVARVLERNGITAPRVSLAPYLSRATYPKPQANASNQLHEVDGVGPIYLNAIASGTTFLSAKTSTTAQFASESTVRAKWKLFWTSLESAGRVWGCLNKCNLTMPAKLLVGDLPQSTSRVFCACVCVLASKRS